MEKKAGGGCRVGDCSDTQSDAFFLDFQDFDLNEEFGEVQPGGTDMGVIELNGRSNAYQTYEFSLKVRRGLVLRMLYRKVVL